MARTFFTLIALVAVASACTVDSTESAPAARTTPRPDGFGWVPVQLTQKSEITVEKILTDIVGKDVAVPDAAGESQPMDWVFEADEPKNAEILERKTSDASMLLVIQLNTGGAPGSDDANVQLSGKLVLQYEWNGRDWVLRKVQNMTFRYTRRMMI